MGPPDWSRYNEYLREKGVVETGARIREYDENIQNISIQGEGARFVSGSVVLRWSLVDATIPYEILVDDRPGHQLVVAATGCAVRVYPDSIINLGRLESLNIVVQRADKGSWNWGQRFVLQPYMDRERLDILSILDECNTISCKASVLVERKLWVDALSIVEEHKLANPSTKELDELYWDIANAARIQSGN
jgi:hypothetical protein